MFCFKQCWSSKWDLELFWSSPQAELTNCLRYYGFSLFPSLAFGIVFLADFLLNQSLRKKNRLPDYFRTYFFRLLINLVLIGSCFFELYNLYETFVSYDMSAKNLNLNLMQLVVTCVVLKLAIYLTLLLFDIIHFLKNVGVSSLSSLVVTVDWLCKSYLLLEYSYLHPDSYPINELVVVAIQFACLTILLISYVFLPNYVALSDEKLNLLSSKEKLNLNQKPNDEFSVHKRSLFSQIMFGYFEEYVFYGNSHVYNVENIMPLENELKVDYVLSDYQKNYKAKFLQDSKFEYQYNILKMVLYLYRWFFVYNLLFLFIIQILLSQFDPLILFQLIEFIKQPNSIRWHGYFLAFLLFLNQMTRVTIVGVFNRNMNYLQTKVQILLVNHIYRKALKRSTLKDNDSSDTYNLMTVDVGIVSSAWYFCADLIQIPLSSVLSIYNLYNLLGVSIFYALLAFIPIIVPVTIFITQKTKRAQKRTMKEKDTRLKILSDLLNGIRLVKLNYWNPLFNSRVTETRNEEVKNFKKYQVFYQVSNINFYAMPILLSVLSFLFFLYTDDRNVLTPQLAFTALNFFGLLRHSLTNIPRTIHLIVTSFVSGKRIQKFLQSKEKEEYVCREYDDQNAVSIGPDVTFSWEENQKMDEYALRKLNVQIKKGSLVALVSKTVASGRTSFLACLMDEMKMIRENTGQKVNISSDMQIAYVGSVPWFEKKSIKENILFGLPFDQRKYDYVLDQCLIREELISYPKADDRPMDQDISLEMGQKVSLARAFYSEAKLILLDDFLGSFNDYLAKRIFDQIINPNKDSLFKGKTCIMVLNRLEYSKYFDQILTFNNGEVTCESDFSEYKSEIDRNNDLTESMEKSPNELYKRSIITKLYNYGSLEGSVEKNDNHDEKNCPNCSKKLIDDEEEVTHLGWPVYKLYFSTWKWYWLVSMIVAYLVQMIFQIVQTGWLGKWSNNAKNLTGDELQRHNEIGLRGYVIYSLAITVFYGIASISAVYGEVNSAIKFHKLLLKKVLSLPIFFFDKTPIGSIINRFSKDMDVIDHVVPWFFKMVVFIGFQILSVFIVISSKLPIAIPFIAVMTVIYCFMFRVFLKTLIVSKRLELQTRTVLYLRFEELSTGLTYIHSYDKTKQFTELLNQQLEANANCSYMQYIAFKWLALRNEILSIIILTVTALLSIYFSDTIDGGSAGQVLTFAVQLTGLLMALMGLVAEFFINFVSIDRICEYLSLEAEEDPHQNSFPPENWPEHGRIEFENFSSTFTECREPVLSDLNLRMEPRSLVAVVGKSGSGKTSLALSLFNAIKRRSGSIRIDDVDITQLGLQQLRKSLAIFPQEAALFTGTLYFNLDPERQYKDSELWTVLEQVGMKDQILAYPGNLHYELTEGGKDLSLSQKQLLCLARTLLKKSKVMIIDETDCQFDLDTEIRLRKLYRTVYSDRTILLITKNIRSIMASDKVLFLYDGHCQDFKEPREIFGERNYESPVDVLDVLNNNNPDLLDLLNNNA